MCISCSNKYPSCSLCSNNGSECYKCINDYCLTYDNVNSSLVTTCSLCNTNLLNSTITNELNVSNYLNVSVINLISNKYLKTSQIQLINVTYYSNNSFQMNLINNTINFICKNVNQDNVTYNLDAIISNNITNELLVSFNISNLTTNYYIIQFYIYFHMKGRFLMLNSHEPNNFSSIYIINTSIFIGTSNEVDKKIQEETEIIKKSDENEEKPDIKVILIAIFASLFGFFVFILIIYFLKRYKKKMENFKL